MCIRDRCIRARMNDIRNLSQKWNVVLQPRIAVATTTNTAQVRVVLCQPPTKQDSAVYAGVERSVRFECVWEKKLEYYILLLRHSKFWWQIGRQISLDQCTFFGASGELWTTNRSWYIYTHGEYTHAFGVQEDVFIAVYWESHTNRNIHTTGRGLLYHELPTVVAVIQWPVTYADRRDQQS